MSVDRVIEGTYNTLKRRKNKGKIKYNYRKRQDPLTKETDQQAHHRIVPYKPNKRNWNEPKERREEIETHRTVPTVDFVR